MTKYLLILFIACSATGCSLLFTYPDKETFQTRIQLLQENTESPVKKTVRIYWNQYAVPFIEAQTDEDLAFALGTVHGHLRIDQLEVLRLISQGRLSEAAGPIGAVQTIDHGLRMLDFMGSAEKSLMKMSTEGRQWMKRFTEGLNWYISRLPKEPVTNKILDIELRPYSLQEVVAITRLVSADLTWATYLKYLKLAEAAEWQQTFDFLQKKVGTSLSSSNNPKEDSLSELIKSFSKSGSNALVVNGAKTQSGSAMIASDPHVGLMLPNFWILVGIKSPSYHACGLMIPGVPIIGAGRNKDIAWGGTNMRGISSHLYDVSTLPSSDIKTKKVEIKRRWWFDTELEIRETPYGPIFSDLNYFEKDKNPFTVAINWLGRSGSDEITSFLKATRSSDWNSFKKSFEDYKVPAMALVYADTKGDIGMIAAYGQPVLKNPDQTLDLVKSLENPIVGTIRPTQNPTATNPKEGYIASANNKPFAYTAIPFSFGYANNHRITRLKKLAEKPGKIDIGYLMEIQRDVYLQAAVDIKELVLGNLNNSKLVSLPLIEKLRAWDGKFNKESEGAIVYYALMYNYWQTYLERIEDETLKQGIKKYDDWRVTLLEWIPTQTPENIEDLTKASLESVSATVKKYPTWGDFTVQPQRTVLGMIPWIGSRFQYADYPVNGSSETLNKYGRNFSLEKQEVTYGASARHISDLASLDENYFVLHGGQDSWLMNENLNDQTPLWRKGEYIKVPLSLDKVKAQFRSAVTKLTPLKKSTGL